jgi:hypothetical protein
LGKKLPSESRLEVGFIDAERMVSVPVNAGGESRWVLVRKDLFGIFASAMLLVYYFKFKPGDLVGAAGGNLQLVYGFVVIWFLVAAAGLVAVLRLFGKSAPEQVILSKPGLTVIAGVDPIAQHKKRGRFFAFWKSQIPKDRRVEFSRDDLKTLRLLENDRDNRLIIDKAGKPFEFARGATKQERQWLFEYLASKYF